jgi:multiple inositol-polyphosphate phosphatase / 2,3-bisphosphoglycerate 3-phosphatase
MKKNSAQLSDRTRFGWMLDWTNPFKVEDAQQLLPIGERQHYDIAKRMARDYPEIFDIPADINFPRAFTIRTSEVPRAAQSGISFAYGLFEYASKEANATFELFLICGKRGFLHSRGKGDLGNSDFRAFYSFSMPRNEDKELRFFKTCPKFQTEILDNDTTYWDSYKYLEMNLPPITERLRRLLGFTGLTDDHTEAMYKACAWEHSLHNTTDRWCSIFEKDDFLMFEFRDDLAFYYESGYGGPSLGYDIACPLIKDMMDRFDKKIEGHPEVEYERARLRFAHAETIIPFLTIMGIFNDSTKLTAFSSKEEIRARKYRISLMSPFAGSTFLRNCVSHSILRLTNDSYCRCCYHVV